MTAIASGLAAALAVLVAWSAIVDRATTRRVAARGHRRGLRPGWAAALDPPHTWGRRSVDHAALLDEVARRVRAGGSLADALASAVTDGDGSRAGAPLQEAVRRHQRGLGLAEACRPLADHRDPAVALTGATLCAVASLGGAAGRALDTAAAALRERALVRADVRAQAATARLSALVLVVLPIGFGGWTVLGDAAARRFLLGSPVGWAVAGTGLALDAAGAWWMRRLVRAGGGVVNGTAPLALGAAWSAWVLWSVLARTSAPRRPGPPRPRRRRRRTAVTALVLATVAAVALGGPLAGVLVPAVGLPTRASRRWALARRDARRAAACVPDLAELVRIAVAAGLTPALALDAAASLGPEPGRSAVRSVLAAVARGRSLGDALGELVARLGPPARPLVDALAATDRYGVPLMPVLDAVVGDLRRQRRLDAQAAARRLPVTLSFPLVGCVLPAFALLTLAPLVAGALDALRNPAAAASAAVSVPPPAVPIGPPGPRRARTGGTDHDDRADPAPPDATDDPDDRDDPDPPDRATRAGAPLAPGAGPR